MDEGELEEGFVYISYLITYREGVLMGPCDEGNIRIVIP